MCLNHVNIVNRSKRFRFHPSSRLYLDVPCGHCCECQSLKYNEYLLRSYYQALECVNNGGYVLFDTLTHAPEHLPTLSKILNYNFKDDFPCFNREYVRLFFSRLRRSLVRNGFDVANKLKYFLVSEYGTREDCQHLPHYHIVLYVNFRISPIDLSRFISDAWIYGRTDGIKYHSSYYVLNHVYGNQSLSNQPLYKLVNYVCKYVVKSSTFSKEIKRRINLAVDSVYADNVNDYNWRSIVFNDNFQMSQTLKSRFLELHRDKLKDFYKRRHAIKLILLRLCSEFHLTSKGFGLAALTLQDISNIDNEGYLRVPDCKCVVRAIPIPLYFRRKLFYELKEDFRGCVHWELNERGKAYMQVSELKSLDLFAQKFSHWFAVADSLLKADVSKLLAGRSWYDFTKYLLFYKGRIKPITFQLEDFDTWFCRIHEDTNDIFIYNYLDGIDFGKRFLSYKYFGDRTCDNLDRVKYRIYRPVLCDKCKFEQKYVINQTTHLAFGHFDDLWDLYCESQKSRNSQKQATSDEIDRLRLLYQTLKH